MKVLFIGAAISIKLAELFLLGSVLPPAIAASVGLLLSLFLLVLGVRTFRGKGEDLAPRRWWRATGAPTSGYWISAIVIVVALCYALGLAIGAQSTSAPQVVANWVTFAFLVGVSFFYLQSSVRLAKAQTSER
jgi:hypothetical protein